MTYDLWVKTGIIKPFTSVDEFEKYTEELNKLPKINIFANTSLRKSKIKKGFNSRSEKFDSFFEFIFVQYMRQIKGYVVERNQKTHSLSYVDPSGKICKFYPDFIVNGQFYEVKGRFTDKDLEKQRQNPDVTFVMSDDIKKMEAELDKNIQNWREDFTQTN